MEKAWVQINKGEDTRSSVLSLTDEGYKLVDEIAPVWENLHHKVQDILGSFNLQQIDIITEAIRSNMEDIKA